MTLLDRVRGILRRTPEGTPGQIEQERETATSLGLMAQAANAGPDMTPEQQIFLSQSEHGMRERLSVLLGIPHRTLAQEREKVAIEQWIGRNAEPAPAPAQTRLRGFLATPAALPLLAGFRPWMAWAGAIVLLLGALGIQTGRLENAKADLRETRGDLRMATENLNEARAVNERLADAVRAADEQSRQAAADLEAERRRVADLRRRQRERAREAQEVLTRNTPPAWDDRLRDLAPAAGSDPAANSDPASLPR